MSFHLILKNRRFTPMPSLERSLLSVMLVSILASCSLVGSGGGEEEELVFAAQEAAQVASEQEATELERQRSRQRAEAVRRQRDAQQAAETARLQATREREAAAAADAADAADARSRLDRQRRQREAAELRERQSLAAVAAAEAQGQLKQARITELEEQILSLQALISRDTAAAELMRQAIMVAEELLGTLTQEQEKYENTDSDGNTIAPLEKDLIAELEERKDDLVRRSRRR